MDNDEAEVICEHEIGTYEMCESLEKAFILSCQLNGVSTEDMAYFRRYVWNIISMIVKGCEFVPMESINQD